MKTLQNKVLKVLIKKFLIVGPLCTRTRSLSVNLKHQEKYINRKYADGKQLSLPLTGAF